MRNQNFKTELAWKSSKYNTLCQCKIITDLTHLLHYQHNIFFFVVRKEAIVRAYKISCCLPRIFLMYNPIWKGVSEEGIKITIARKCLRKSFGVRRKQSITGKIAFYYFKHLILMQINCFQTRSVVLCLPFFAPLLRNRKLSKWISFLNRGYWLAGMFFFFFLFFVFVFF